MSEGEIDTDDAPILCADAREARDDDMLGLLRIAAISASRGSVRSQPAGILYARFCGVVPVGTSSWISDSRNRAVRSMRIETADEADSCDLANDLLDLAC